MNQVGKIFGLHSKATNSLGLKVIPLGGLGEIGKNMMALEYDEDIIIIDAGIMFPDDDMPGVDLIIPDVSYLLERRHKIRAILITHGHEDHTGALPYILAQVNVPVYAPKLAAGLIRVKLREHHLESNVELNEITPGEHFPIGTFNVEFFRVCHSIPDAMGIIVNTPIGLVVHTGDFKFDHTPVDGNRTDFTRLANLGQEGVFLLLSDSTYVELDGHTPSETVISGSLERIISEAKGRVLVATFASLISRIQQVIDAAHKDGRVVAVSGRSMVENVKMSIQMGYLNIPEGVLVPLKETRGRPPEKVVVITTGTQGEPTSSLVRISKREHRDLEILENDTIVISASPIPGNETLIYRTINNLLRQGAKVLSPRNAQVHVHGHASAEELKLMLRLTKPKYFVPLHGEFRHLIAHANLAKSMGVNEENVFVLEDGTVLELNHSEGSIVERFPCGHIFVEGKDLSHPESKTFQERRNLSQEGIILVVVTIGKANNKLLKEPLILAPGFIETNRYEEILKESSLELQNSLIARLDEELEHDELPQFITENIRRSMSTHTRRRPLIRPIIVEV
ncbi:ribonuclease J [SAR202 cluster bacterium AD-802-E10_MRT_200m]|nr:ribonuclease J [SAR202 cluster bacterium AD-802-E10_MRT_200m]